MIRNAIVALSLCFFVTSSAFAQLKNQQTWQNATIASDALTVQCSQLLVPSMIGRLLSEPSPIVTNGEMANSLLSPHPIKLSLQPESGITDNLANITGCTIDGVEVWVAMADATDSATIVHGTSTNNISTPDATNFTISGNRRIYQFVRNGGLWLLSASAVSSGGGSGGSITITDGQKIDFQMTIDSATEGLFPPCQNSCAQAIGFRQICIDCDDRILYMGTGTGIVPLLGGGGGTGGGCSDADNCVDLNRIIDNRDGVNQALVIKSSGNAAVRIYGDAQGPVVDGVTGFGTTNTPAVPRERKSWTIPAGKFVPDGTLCEYLYDVTINTLKIPVGLTCNDDNAATLTISLMMPDQWDGTTLQLYSALHTKEATPGGAYHIDWSGYCVVHGGPNGNASWATETANSAMDISLDTHAQHDLIFTGTAGNIPLANCGTAGKKVLWLRGQVDATGTTADDGGAGTALDDQIFTEFQIEYGLNAFTN